MSFGNYPLGGNQHGPQAFPHMPNTDRRGTPQVIHPNGQHEPFMAVGGSITKTSRKTNSSMDK